MSLLYTNKESSEKETNETKEKRKPKKRKTSSMKKIFTKWQYYQKQSIDLIQYNPHQNNSDILHKKKSKIHTET